MAQDKQSQRKGQQRRGRLPVELQTFFRLHIILGLLIPPVVAGIFYASNKATYVPYVDSLFSAFLSPIFGTLSTMAVVTSAMSGTGLITVLIASVSRWQQVILYLLFQVFSIPSIALITLAVRRLRFKQYLRDSPAPRHSMCEVMKQEDEVREECGSLRDIQSQHEKLHSQGSEQARQGTKERLEAAAKSDDSSGTLVQSDKDVDMGPTGMGGFGIPISPIINYGLLNLRRRVRQRPSPSATRGSDAEKGKDCEHCPSYISNGKWEVGRNSNFIKLDPYQHQEVGELEIKAMNLLLVVFASFMLLMQMVMITIIAPDLYAGNFNDQFVNEYSTSRFWFSVFISGSFFNNVGMSLIDSSLTGFLRFYAMLVPSIFLMLGGNLLFGPSIRVILMLLSKCVRRGSQLSSTLAFVLDHPRRVTYLLFPPFETIVLCCVVLTLLSIDWGCFYLLDIGYESIFSVPTGPRVLAGAVQAVAVRSSGFYTIQLSLESPALHVLYLIMLLLAVYPLAMTIRTTNCYEARALGISDADDERSYDAGKHHLEQERSYVSVHMASQLSYDVWAILLGIWLICIIERHNLTDPDKSSYFNVFSVIFESASAYANCGLSLGLPYSNASLAAEFNTLSKLILCALMVRGRTRGLPVAQDRAIMTPKQLKRHGDPPLQETGDRGFSMALEAEAQADS